MDQVPFWKLIGGLALAFSLPLIFMVIAPYAKFADLAGKALDPSERGQEKAESLGIGLYSEEQAEEVGVPAYPSRTLQRAGASDFGRIVYAAEGCAYCHTQVIRPTYLGADLWRPGWGGREEDGLARETRPGDYVNESIAPLGYQRIGQDLSNLGHRVTTAEEMHRHLYDPTSFDPDSQMPAYPHLYKRDLDRGEIHPTPRAEALVDYLLSLKKDQPLPAPPSEG
ncbi:MAG: cbb3-type cytochrome c oxidase subunit II [Verrucomicrobiota bacterium]